MIAWVKTWAPGVQHAWEVQEVVGYADLAFSRATVTSTYPGKDGKKVTERYQTVCLHRRQPDGRWMFARGMNVPLDPLPASATAKRP
jgi:ketosteroid isomerase-like protein